MTKKNVSISLSALFLLWGILAWSAFIFLKTKNLELTAYFFFSSKTLASYELGIHLDPISVFFIGSVSIISSGVYMFSQNYMMQEKLKFRFYFILFLFILSMMTLILSANLLTMIIGWDGLGLSSYMLVIFFNSVKSSNAGMLTVMTNRLGDAAIILSISFFMSFNFYPFSNLKLLDNHNFQLCFSLLVFASMTKSAQIPFSSWLPAAMAAPTPVSALVHSSTLVTAGVYLMLRMSSWMSSALIILVLLAGSLTLFMASLSATVETDIKKMIALSTLSQLGLMMVMIGMNQPQIAFFHLNTHAFFKSLLFISAGDMIHEMSGWQDSRKMSFSSSHVHSIPKFAFIANASLMGTPFLAGFFSKDIFLEMNLGSPISLIGATFTYSSIFLTVLYTVRFLTLTSFFLNKNMPLSMNEPPKSSSLLQYPILIILSISAGSPLMNMLMPFDNFIFIPPTMKSLPFLIFVTSVSFAHLLMMKTSLMKKFPPMSFLYLDKICSKSAVMIFQSFTFLANTKKNEISFLKLENTVHPFLKYPSLLMKLNAFTQIPSLMMISAMLTVLIFI